MGRTRHQIGPTASAKGVGSLSPAESSVHRTRTKERIFRWVIFLLGPLLVLACIEGTLHLAAYGYPTGFFLRSTAAKQDVLIQNDRFSWRFFGPALARTPRPMMFPLHKAPDTCRIFVFGESAAYGDPKPDFGLPRLLQVLLQDAIPGKKIEVINVAMTGINSHAILPIVRDCTPLEGDVWVVYMGNNEVVGPFGSGTVFGPTAPPLSLIRASLALKTTRLGQLLSVLISRFRPPATDQHEWGMRMFLGAQVMQDDPRMQTVYTHFEHNLSDILRQARKRGVRVVLGTVVTNLKDCAPFASLHRSGLSEPQKQQWEQLRQAGRAARLAGAPQQAVEKFEAAAEIDDRFAELHFEWAICELALGQREKALRHFSLARDYDTLRFRADSRINEIIRQTASRHAADGVLLAECERIVAAESAFGIAGEESLYEHVHFNFAGNYRAARCLADPILKALRSGASAESAPPPSWLTIEECSRRLAWTSFDECKTLKSVMLRLAEAPFTAQLNHSDLRRRLQSQIERLLPSLKPDGLRAASQIYSNALSLQPGDWVLHKNYGDLLVKLGNLAEAEKCYAQVIRLLPHDTLAYLQLGLLQLQADRPQEAILQFETALRLEPDSVPILNGLAVALTSIQRPDDALRYYRRALAVKPLSSETHLNLATALQSWDRSEEALQHLNGALAHPPDTPDFRIKLGKAAAAHGWLDIAITNFTQAVDSDPVDPSAHFYLGSAFLQKRAHLQARQHLAEAVRLDPDSAKAHLGLGIVLLETGQNTEAIQQLSRAASLDPRNIEAPLNIGIAFLRLGQTGEARLSFERVLQLDPANLAAKKFLASVPTDLPR